PHARRRSVHPHPARQLPLGVDPQHRREADGVRPRPPRLRAPGRAAVVDARRRLTTPRHPRRRAQGGPAGTRRHAPRARAGTERSDGEQQLLHRPPRRRRGRRGRHPPPGRAGAVRMTAPGPLYPPFYPPAYPIVPVPAPVPERLLVNGEPITGWCDIEGLTNLIVAPPPRGANVTVPGRHGVIRTPRKPRGAAEIVLPLWVKGVNRSDGNIPPRSAARLHENLDYLLTIFHGETVELEYVRDDGTSRTVTAELAEEPVVAVRERSYPPLARLSVPLTLFDPFWTEDRDVATTITGVTGTAGALNAFAGSTAPITDAVITFY